MVTSGELAGQDLVSRVAHWALWSRPRHWIMATLTAMGVAIALTVASIVVIPVTLTQVGMFSLITGLAVVQTEITRRIERQRRILSDGPHITVTSVWLLPASLLVPPQLVAALGVVLYGYLAFRSWSGTRPGEAHRVAANATTMILSGFAAGLGGHLTAGHGVLTVTVAAAAFCAMNIALTGLGLYLADPAKATTTSVLGTVDDNVLDTAILCVGALLYMVLTDEPLLSALVILPLYVLQRSVLIKRLEELATTDQKTQLLNAATWQDGAQREVSRAEREPAPGDVQGGRHRDRGPDQAARQRADHRDEDERGRDGRHQTPDGIHRRRRLSGRRRDGR